jgi:hypothetical protein
MLGRLCDVNLRMLGGNQVFLADHEPEFFDSAELWYDFYTCIPSSTDCWVYSNRETCHRSVLDAKNSLHAVRCELTNKYFDV